MRFHLAQDCSDKPNRQQIADALELGFKILSGELADPNPDEGGDTPDAEQPNESSGDISEKDVEREAAAESSSSSSSSDSPPVASSSKAKPAKPAKAAKAAAGGKAKPKAKAKGGDKSEAKAKPQPLDTSNVKIPERLKRLGDWAEQDLKAKRKR